MSYFLADILPELGLFSTTRDSTVTMLARQFGRAVSARVLDQGRRDESPAAERARFNEIINASGVRCWTPEIAAANEFSRRGPSSAAIAIAQLTVSLALLGLQGSFEFLLPYPERLLIGFSRPRCSGRLRIESEPNKILLETDDDRFEYALSGGMWLGSATPPNLVARSSLTEILYASGYAIDPELLIDEDAALSADLFEAAVADLDAALRLVEAAGPPAFAWVTRLIRVVSIVASEGGARLSSRTLPARSGNIEIAAPGNRMHLAELLVHEAAHQHFHLGALLGPYVIEEARGLAFLSALNGRLRPLDRVALAFHAVGNIFVFLECLVRRGGSVEDDARLRLAELGPTASALVETMRAQAHLFTDHGKDLLGTLCAETERIIGTYELSSDSFERSAVRGVHSAVAAS